MGWRQAEKFFTSHIQDIPPRPGFIQGFLGAGPVDKRSCVGWVLALGKWLGSEPQLPPLGERKGKKGFYPTEGICHTLTDRLLIGPTCAKCQSL